MGVKAKDIMSRNLITVKKNTSVFEAIQTLVEHQITGLPVVESGWVLEGIVTEKDFLRLINETTADEKTVAQVMTTQVISFQEEDSVEDICTSLIKNNFRRVPILKGNKLVGIISRRDVIKFILRQWNKDQHA